MNLPNGVYRARALEGTLGETKSGKEQVIVRFALLSPGFEEQRITWFGFFTEKTYKNTVKALRTCGWKGDDLGDLTGIDANEVDLVIENETWEGVTRPKVQWINAIDGMTLGTPLPKEKAKSFAASMRAKVRAVDAEAGARPAPKQAPKQEPVEEDLPF